MNFSSNCIKIVHPLYQKRTISYSICNYCIVNHLYFNPACDWGIFFQNIYKVITYPSKCKNGMAIAKTFILAIISSVVIAWITVGHRAVKAAMANPVKSLRTE